MRTLIAIVCGALLLGGCASGPSSKYNWGDYETSLYAYYKAPDNLAAYQASLKAIIDIAASTPQRRAPPGIYAEYGYLLMLQKQNAEAIRYFELEKTTWPEAGPFMDTMVRIAQGTLAQAAPAIPATATATDAAPADTAPSTTSSPAPSAATP